MIKQSARKTKRVERKRRVRAKISGTAVRPRLSVFRSLRSISVQAIDDIAGQTLCSASLVELGKSPKHTVESAAKVGALIAEKCAKAGISEAVFDRSGYRYHGKVKALAEGARQGGLKF